MGNYTNFYNSERKNDYCESIAGTQSQMAHVISFFNVISKYEDSFDKDLCEFTAEEIATVFSTWKTYKEKSNKKTILRRYITWCVKQGYVSADALNEFHIFLDSFFNMKAVTNEYFYSEEDLVNRIQAVMSNMHISYYARAIIAYWLVFHRVEYSDILALRKDDVDFGNRKIHVVRTIGQKNQPVKNEWIHETIDIPECMVEMFEHALYDRSFQAIDGRVFIYPKSNMLISPSYNAGPDEQTTVYAMNKFNKQIHMYSSLYSDNDKLKDLVPNKKSLYRSGVFCDVYKEVKENVTGKVMAKYIPIELHKTEISHYMKDYEVWLENRDWILGE